MRATLLCMGLAVLAAGCATLDRQPLAFSELAYAGADGAAWAARALPLPALQAAEGLATPLTMHAVEAGPAEGPPVVLLHDVGGYASVWRAQIASLAGAGQRVIALDLIGHGKSSKPGAFSYSAAAQSAAVAEALVAMGVERARVVGHGFGAQVALALALTVPERVSGLALLAPAGLEKYSEREQAWFRENLFGVLFTYSDDEDLVRAHRDQFARRADENRWLLTERARLGASPDFPAHAHALVRSLHAFAANDFVQTQLEAVRAPTFVLFGGADRLLPFAMMHPASAGELAAAAARIPGAQVRTAPGCGHLLPLDCPEEVEATLKALIAAP